MRRTGWNVLGTAACALLFALSMTATTNPAPQAHQAETHQGTRKKAAMHHWRAETLAGKITMVDSAKKLLVVRDSSGTPFDMVVTHSTRIEAGNRSLKLSDLESKVSQGASVHFVPKPKGNVAQSIQIG